MKLQGINSKILLAAVLVLAWMVPSLLGIGVVTAMSNRSNIEEVRTALQNEGLILSDKMSRGAYFAQPASGRNVDNELSLLADVYDGRITVVNHSFRVVYDTFHVAEGKYHVAPEIVRCFRGETSNKYNDDKGYLIQTFPIYDANEGKNVEGVMLISASTLKAHDFEANMRESSLLMLLALGMLALLVSIPASMLMHRPFDRLNQAMKRISTGSLKGGVQENGYRITSELSESISATMARMEAIDRSREDFVSNVSHELKTPITSIRLLADSLKSMDQVPPELYEEFMQDISEEIDREARIIDDLLELVKMDQGALELRVRPVDLIAIVKIVLKRVRPMAERRNIELSLEQVREVSVEGDESQLTLALTNLIENAVKYNKEDGSVRVTVDADHQNAYVTVRDTGVGIPEDQQSLVFERFYRVDKARSRETGGTGLGLSITRDIIQMHKGSITLESTEGVGTVFTVTIPLRYMTLQDVYRADGASILASKGITPGEK